MSMLTIVQYHCRRTNLTIPVTVTGSTDKQVQQIMSLLEEEGNDLASRGPWQGITFEATHTTTAVEDQGAMTTIAANGFSYIKNDTIWDRTDQEPIYGPVSDQDWQALKAVTTAGPRYQYRIRGGKLLLNPVPTAGHTIAFEYVSKNWIIDNTGVTYRQYFTSDTDCVLLPEELLLLGLRWRWKKEKGLEYAEDFRTYEFQIHDAFGRDKGNSKLNMGDGAEGKNPKVFIPAGNFVTP